MSLLAEVDWSRLFDMPGIAIICVFGMIVIVTVAGIIGGVWKSVEIRRSETRLKEEMIAKGYAADEIERVVRATAGEEGEGGSPMTNDQ